MDRELLLPTREGIYCQNVFSSCKGRNTPRFWTLLFGKEAVKTLFYKCSNSGRYESTPQQIYGNKVVENYCFSEIPAPKKALQKMSLDFWFQKSVLRPADFFLIKNLCRSHRFFIKTSDSGTFRKMCRTLEVREHWARHCWTLLNVFDQDSDKNRWPDARDWAGDR